MPIGKIPKQVNLLQPKLDIKYFVVLVIVIAMILFAVAIGTWLKGFVSGIIKPVTGKAEEPTI